jgi:cobalt-zinc-cadmium efflux system membrane fusion protein
MHIKNFLTGTITIVSVFFIALACNHKRENRTTPSDSDTATATEVLRFTPEQTKLAGIETGKIESGIMGIILVCNGKIEAPPENVADVTVPVGGLVKSCPYHPGDYISNGQRIAVLEHPDYIKIQQDFLETKSQWEYYKEDFKRQGELTVENAASVKTMQQAQADFRVTEVKLFSLKNQLKLLGINADSLNIENISSTVNIVAPISGYITDIKINIGKYVDPQQMVCEILNKNNLYLKLFIYEKDIHRIKTGQSLEFSLISDPGRRYGAFVKGISPKIDESNNAFSIHAHILKAEPWFNPGMFVKAFISIAEHSCLSVPSSAIVNDNNEQAVFIKTSGGFKRVIIKTGITENDRVEIIEFPDGLSDAAIVLNGAYYLNAAWKNRE